MPNARPADLATRVDILEQRVYDLEPVPEGLLHGPRTEHGVRPGQGFERWGPAGERTAPVEDIDHPF